jgi:hypothetical protein
MDPDTMNRGTFSLPFLALWLISASLLALGLTRPVIEISVNVEGVLRDAVDHQPIVGLLLQEKGIKLNDLVSKLPPSSVTRQSITSSAMKLYRFEAYSAATLILIFSIIIPITKQIALLIVVLFPFGRSGQINAVTKAIHKWAMLDVFVLAMVVLALSSATAWNAVLLDGFYWFLGYFFSAGALGILLTRRFKTSGHLAAAADPNELMSV